MKSSLPREPLSQETLAGLEFRTEVLDKDLLLEPETGLAKIMPEEFFNVYDRTGPGYSSYKP